MFLKRKIFRLQGANKITTFEIKNGRKVKQDQKKEILLNSKKNVMQGVKQLLLKQMLLKPKCKTSVGIVIKKNLQIFLDL